MAARDEQHWPPAAPGSRVISNRWAWVREFTKDAGPDSTTRLVLLVMAAAMDEDGTKCLLGARELGRRSALNKETAALCRLRALEAGWLQPPRDRHGSVTKKGAPLAEWLPSVPAAVAETLSTTPAVSGPAGHLKETVSGMGRASVRIDRAQCPAQPDKPASYQPYNHGASTPTPEQRRQLANLVRVERQSRHDRTWEDLARRIPPSMRYRGCFADVEKEWNRCA